MGWAGLSNGKAKVRGFVPLEISDLCGVKCAALQELGKLLKGFSKCSGSLWLCALSEAGCRVFQTLACYRGVLELYGLGQDLLGAE